MRPTSGRAEIGNLPPEASSFIGRRRELGELKRLQAESRLVTLTGPGGTGKTRMAVRAGGELRRAFPGGVWFVDLTELHEPGLLTQEVQDPETLAYLVSASLGLRKESSLPPLRLLVEELADRQLLLVLDNCEHLVPAVVVLLEQLLRGCPQLRVLATSREALGISGEVLFPVPPLPLPVDEGAGLAELSRSEAVGLFVARARAVVSDFAVDEANAPAVVELCRRLDGLPLAIELAAARIRTLSPEQVLDRMGDRFALLRRRGLAGPERQRTLRACVEWSFELCAKPEQILWARLSVFAGGFELDAVEGVCADERVPEMDVLDLVAGLVDKSILVRDHAGPAARYRMLETIREYGEERLAGAGEQAEFRRWHRDWYQGLVARAEQELISPRQSYWRDRLRREHANLRAAVEYCMAVGEAEAALRMIVPLPVAHWSGNAGRFGEGVRWLVDTLAQATAPTPLRAQALLRAARLASMRMDFDAARPLLREGEDLARRFEDRAQLAAAASLRGTMQSFQGDHAGALRTLDEAQALLSSAAQPSVEQQLELLQSMSFAAGGAGDHSRAAACLRQILAISEAHGETGYRGGALMAAALAAWGQGDLDEAAGYLKRGIAHDHARAVPEGFSFAMWLEILAWVNGAQGHHRRAATLLGAADGLWSDPQTSIHAWPHLVGFHHDCERRAREAMGEAAYAADFRTGRTMELADALAYAREEPRRPVRPSAAPAAADPAALTRRERQVAELLAEGLSNKEIAGRLVLSQRTAESHVERILAKLGFTNRAQVAAWMTRERTEQDR